MTIQAAVIEERPLYDTLSGTGRRKRCRLRGQDPDQIVLVEVTGLGECRIIKFLPGREGKTASPRIALVG